MDSICNPYRHTQYKYIYINIRLGGWRAGVGSGEWKEWRWGVESGRWKVGSGGLGGGGLGLGGEGRVSGGPAMPPTCTHVRTENARLTYTQDIELAFLQQECALCNRTDKQIRLIAM